MPIKWTYYLQTKEGQWRLNKGRVRFQNKTGCHSTTLPQSDNTDDFGCSRKKKEV